MRKSGIVFLAAVLLITVCFGTLHGYYIGVSDDVTVTRQTLYGDPSAAEGVNILVRNQYEQHLLWETSVTLNNHPVPETEFTFSNERVYLREDLEYTGIEFNVMTNHLFVYEGISLPEYSAKKYSALVKAINREVGSVKEGECKTFTIDFSEYMDYYPLEGQVILPDYLEVFSEFESWTDQSEEIAIAINDFFRIPLDGRYAVEYTIDREDNSRSYGASVELDYDINAGGVATEDACYFTFNTLREDGTVVDTGLIPGGYGIYRLSYDEKGLKLDSLEMVYALDPQYSYVDMALSGDGKRIRLLTWEGDELVLTVIDIAAMTQLQRVCLATRSEDWRFDVISYDDFLLVLENRSDSVAMDRITVWEESGDGTLIHGFTANMNMDVFPEGTNLNLFDRYSNAVDYQNGKLVIVKNRMFRQEPYWYRDYCDIYVAVYDESGMLYAGTCEWNLTKVNSLEPNNIRVRPCVENALEVSW